MTSATPLAEFRRITVLGLGLIGGSLLVRLAEIAQEHASTTLPPTLVGFDIDPATRTAARERLGEHATIVDALPKALDADVDSYSDLLVIAVPLPAVPPIAQHLSVIGYRGLVTDTVSVKGAVRELSTTLAPKVRWVGGHPMAGREQSGFHSANPLLFTGCTWVLTLDEATDLNDWLRTAQWVLELGARVVPASSAEHDTATARISHLPHVVAEALARRAGMATTARSLALGLAAGSFHDGTRVAGTRPELVAAMCVGNAPALVSELDALIVDLKVARELLQCSSHGTPVDDATGTADESPFVSWCGPGYQTRINRPAAFSTLRPGDPDQAMGHLATIPVLPADLLQVGTIGGFLTSINTESASVWLPDGAEI